MSITIQSRIMPLGQLLQNEPHLRLHDLRLARNSNYNWAEFVAINGGVSYLEGQAPEPVAGQWPDEAYFLARAERTRGDGELSPWIFAVYCRNTAVSIEFPDLAIGPIPVCSISSSWGYYFVEVLLPVAQWCRFQVFLSLESDPSLPWMVWGERPLASEDLLPVPSEPVSLSPPVAFGDTSVGEFVYSTVGVWAGEPRPSFTFQWYKEGGTPIAGATEFQWFVDAALVGFEVYCEVTATNSEDTEVDYSNSIGPVTSGLSAPVNTVAPVVSGTTVDGSVLSCTTGTWTGTPTITYAYQWIRDNGVTTTNVGTDSPNYTLVTADVGNSILCNVTATNGVGSASQVSNTVGPIASASSPPVNTVAPAITGTFRYDEVLTCSSGTWTGSPTPTYDYQWQRGGVDIGGATSSTYTIVALDMYDELTCVVTATNSDPGSPVDATSNSVSSPLKPIWDIDPDAAIWVKTAGWSVAVSSPEGAWSTADARWTWAQSSSTLKPTRVSDGLSFDGGDDHSICDTLASVCNGAHTTVIGWTQGSEGATPARTVWAANSDDSSANTYQVSLNYSRPDLTNATRMSARWAGASVVTVSLVSLGSKGAGPYLVAQVSGAQGSAARAESLDTPLVEVGSLTRPSGTATYEWLTLGAKRQGAGPSVVQPWLGVIHSFCLLAVACSDAQLETIRDAIAAEEAL